MKLALNTSIHIKASVETIWNTLTDFKSYPEWNPLILSLTGKVAEGEKIRVNVSGMKFAPIVLTFNANQKLEWQGKLGVKGVFDGRHSFELEPCADGTVIFRQNEQFSGILVGMFRKKLEKETLPQFKAMNEALKQRCEHN